MTVNGNKELVNHCKFDDPTVLPMTMIEPGKVVKPNQEEDMSSRIISKLRNIPCAGIVLAMLSGIFFATAGFIVKLVPMVNPVEIVVTR